MTKPFRSSSESKKLIIVNVPDSPVFFKLFLCVSCNQDPGLSSSLSFKIIKVSFTVRSGFNASEHHSQEDCFEGNHACHIDECEEFDPAIFQIVFVREDAYSVQHMVIRMYGKVLQKSRNPCHSIHFKLLYWTGSYISPTLIESRDHHGHRQTAFNGQRSRPSTGKSVESCSR